MVEDQIFVDSELFLGRIEEQSQFRQSLQAVINAESKDAPVHLFLLKGQPGTGKSKLLRRLRDIAAKDSPFEATTQTMLVDWEIVRYRPTESGTLSPLRQVSRVFARLYQSARDAGWGHQFSDYQTGVRQLNRAEKNFAEAVEQEGWVNRYTALHDLDPEALARVIRQLDIPGRDPGAGDVQPAKTHETYRQADEWLKERVSMDEEEEKIFRLPNRCLAKKLAIGLAKTAQAKPLVLLLDSCEWLGEDLGWIQEVMQHAGGRVIWVVACGNEKVLDGWLDQGQPSGFQSWTYELDHLTEEQVGKYLLARTPDRLVTRDSIEGLYKVTRGLPLALQLVGDLWAGGVPHAEIASDLSRETSDEELLESLSQRLLVNCTDPTDSKVLTFLSLQRRPSEEILAEIIQPAQGTFDLRQVLRRLKARYMAIWIEGEVRLHSTVSEAICRYLLRRRIRLSEEVKQVAAVAVKACGRLRDELEAGFPRLEDRFASQEWRDIALDHLFWMFLDNEFDAWRQINRDFVDALGYDMPHAHKLLELLDRIEPILSKNGRQRLKVYQSGLADPTGVDGQPDPAQSGSLDLELSLLAELERWLTRYGGKDVFASERSAILDIQRGELFLRYGRMDDALNMFLKAEKNLPSRGESLTRLLGQNLERVGHSLAWQRRGDKIVSSEASPSAETSLKKAISLGRRRAKTYHALASVQEKLGKLEVSLENLLQAVTLNPGVMEVWFALGEVYRKQELYEKAVPAYRRAIELEPTNVRVGLSLAVCYRLLRDEKEFTAQRDRVQRLLAQENDYLRACYAGLTSNLKPALALLEAAVEKKQATREMIRQEPCFDFIRREAAFQQFESSIP